MLAAIIILSLLSLLVATEADPTGSTTEPAGDKTLRPSGKGKGGNQTEPLNPGRLAA